MVISPPVLTCSLCPGCLFSPSLLLSTCGLHGPVSSKDLWFLKRPALQAWRGRALSLHGGWFGQLSLTRAPLPNFLCPMCLGDAGSDCILLHLSVFQSSGVFSGIYYIPNGLCLQFGVLQGSSSNLKEAFLNFKAVERHKIPSWLISYLQHYCYQLWLL